MLGLPKSTEVNRRVAKEKLYANANMNTQLRDEIKDNIEVVIWRNKLAESTFNISKGKTVNELQIFEIQLRQRGLDKKVLTTIAKAIPYKILFVLTFEHEAQAWMEVSERFYNTEWLPIDELAFPFEGLNLDAVYENLARKIAGRKLDSQASITEAVERDKYRQKLEREISALQKRMLQETHFNRQVEMHGELKKLIVELEALN